MSRKPCVFAVSATVVLGAFFAPGPIQQTVSAEENAQSAGRLRIGWASADITPEKPVVMSGGSRARISTGVMDPITVTALVLESVAEDGKTIERVAQVSVDVSSLREDGGLPMPSLPSFPT